MPVEPESVTMPMFIAGDWGTSNLRLYLCERTDVGARVVETRHGPGISQLDGNFETAFFDFCADWLDQRGNLPVILSGMVGSTLGWKEAPYLDCPVDESDIAAGRLAFNARGVEFSILAGLRTQNPLGLPDVMRGEELQLMGWRLLNPERQEQRLFALPGTHNKWALFSNNKIQTFASAFTGELYAILKDHSILSPKPDTETFCSETFMQGAQLALNLREANILHALFSMRSRQVLGEMVEQDSLSYLSGLIIGADIQGALALFNSDQFKSNVEAELPITLIGEPALSERYQRVLKHLNIKAEITESSTIAIAGYTAIYKSIYE